MSLCVIAVLLHFLCVSYTVIVPNEFPFASGFHTEREGPQKGLELIPLFLRAAIYIPDHDKHTMCLL